MFILLDEIFTDPELRAMVPVEARAIETLKTEFAKYVSSFTPKPVLPKEEENVDTIPPAKKSRSMFALVSNLGAKKSSNEDTLGTDEEIDGYLALPLNVAENESPLKFWELNEKKFPRLAKFAINVLGMPASSAEVERLFSVAGSISKARSARLRPETMERSLCCRYYKRANVE